MDPLATLLLARTHIVVLDPDRVASASTRPARDVDIERFEIALVHHGFVMSLDLAMTVRRLPHDAVGELTSWMLSTLAVPPTRGSYAEHALPWLHAPQPCPWCGTVAELGALDPCGHLVCRRCWSSGAHAGCAICHRRVSPNEPFIARTGATRDGALHVLHLAIDLAGVVRDRFARMLGRAAPLSSEDRAELELIIDTLGPKVAMWLPARIPVRETLAIVLARLWMVAPDRVAMMRATRDRLATATDVLRIAAVLMKGNAALVEPMRLSSIPRGMRRAILEALEQLPAELVAEDMRRHRGLWKRVGERLHPGELADTLPNVARAFAGIRGAKPETMSWGGRVETALGRGDVRAATALVAERPAEVIRRIDHLVRVTLASQPDALGDVLATLRAAVAHATASALLVLAAHASRRGMCRGEDGARPADGARDGDPRVLLPADGARGAPLPANVVAAIIDAAHGELVARAAARRNFARAVIDRDVAVWDIAAIHAAARANTIYVRHAGPRDDALGARHRQSPAGPRDDVPGARHRQSPAGPRDDASGVRHDVHGGRATIAVYKRRDAETHLARLRRLVAGDADATIETVPPADVPTWFALVREDLVLPRGSEGYGTEMRTDGDAVTRVVASALIAELAGRS